MSALSQSLDLQQDRGEDWKLGSEKSLGLKGSLVSKGGKGKEKNPTHRQKANDATHQPEPSQSLNNGYFEKTLPSPHSFIAQHDFIWHGTALWAAVWSVPAVSTPSLLSTRGGRGNEQRRRP